MTGRDRRATVLVTGGAGAIGSNVARSFAADRRVTVLDDLSSGHEENIRGAAVELVRGSITDNDALDRAFSPAPDVVLHLAAFFANQNSVDHPERDLAVNGIGTIKLLERARAVGVRRFVYASSSSVYENAWTALAEDALSDSVATPYAITKRLGERYVAFHHQRYGLPTVVLRLFNVYGPGERPGRYRNVIPNLLFRALTGRALVITGTGEETRDFTYVDDVVAAFALAADRTEAVGGTFNIGSGVDTSVRALVDKIGALVGDVPVEQAPRRLWDTVTRRQADIRAARAILGYVPRVGIDDGLRRTLEWFRTLDLALLDAE